MADKKKKSERQEIKLRRIPHPNASQEEFYSVNFKNYLVKRGETVSLPSEVVEVIRNSEAAEDEAIAYVESKALREPKNEL